MAPVKKKQVPKGVRKKAGGKKKKQILKFNIECKNPVEDGIMNVSDFEVFLNERIKVNGKVGQMAANGVKIELQKTKLILTSEVPFSNTLFELPDEEISQKKFSSRLVASGGVLEGYLRIAVLPDQSG
uniref:Large ribosomal subunit protein eL22 n=1 Tax=Ascaris suum TaxID=6253 RepID=F1LH15_ASCSU